MSRFTRRIALVVAGAGVVAGAAVGVAQAAPAPGAASVVPNSNCSGDNDCVPVCPPGTYWHDGHCVVPNLPPPSAENSVR